MLFQILDVLGMSVANGWMTSIVNHKKMAAMQRMKHVNYGCTSSYSESQEKTYPTVTAKIMALFFSVFRSTEITLWLRQDVCSSSDAHPSIPNVLLNKRECVGAEDAWDSFFNQRSWKLGRQDIHWVNGKNRNQLKKEVIVSKLCQMSKSSYCILLCIC